MRVTEWDYRIADTLKMAKTFIEESALPVTYSQDNSVEYLWSVLHDKNSALFVEYIGDDVAGGIIVSAPKEFHNERFGYLIKLYVLPIARGTGVGRALVKQATDWFDEQGCVRSFASATAAIGQDKAFINLLGKFGYSPNGEILIRNLGK